MHLSVSEQCEATIYPNTTFYQYLKSGSGNGFPNDMHHADMHRNFLADLKIDMT